jgi:putative redox protein
LIGQEKDLVSAIYVKWIESKLMLGIDSQGKPVVLSSWPERDPKWTGLKPSDLLLIAAASCAMYDVVEILKKQREPLTSLEVMCEGTQLPDPPYTFVNMHFSYKVHGGVNPEKLDRAIDLAQNKYCSVIATLRESVKLTYEFECMPLTVD